MQKITKNTLLNYISSDLSIEQTINPARIFEANNNPIRKGNIVYFIKREIRAKHNYALQFAINKSIELNLPLKIIHLKINYEYKLKQNFIDSQIFQTEDLFQKIGFDFEITDKKTYEFKMRIFGRAKTRRAKVRRNKKSFKKDFETERRTELPANKRKRSVCTKTNR